MSQSKAASPSTAAKQAAFLDGIARRLSVEAACAAAGISRRLPYHWKANDPAFADKWAEIAEDAEHLVNKRQVSEWRDQLGKHESELSKVEAELAEIAAPAMAGDADAVAKRDALRARHQKVAEAAQALRQAITSGEQHLQRQADEKAERDRQAAQVEATEHHAAQVAAAERVDRALAEIEQAYAEFARAGNDRDSAARRAGGRARHTYNFVLTQAVWRLAPSVAHALGLSAAQRTGKAAPLAESVR